MINLISIIIMPIADNATTLEIPRIDSLEQLDEQAVQSLNEIPALIIGQPTMPEGARRMNQEARERTRSVGESLASIIGGEYTPEFKKLSVPNGYELHFDGNSNFYWQIHTAYSKDAYADDAAVPGTKFKVEVHDLQEPLDMDFLMLILGGQKIDPLNTYFLLNSRAGREGISETLAKLGRLPLIRSRVFTGFVPLGDTIIFVNGFGTGNDELFFHDARCAYDKRGLIRDSWSFTRFASLGRVQVGGSVL